MTYLRTSYILGSKSTRITLATHVPDATDLAIIRILQQDGRRAYTDIAAELGISEGTVRHRVATLTEAQALKIVGVADPYHLGFDALALIGISVEPGALDKVIEPIAAFEEVTFLFLTSGDFDLMAEVMCRDRNHLADFLTSQLRQVPGVLRTQTHYVLKAYKMSYGAWPIVPAGPARLR